MDNKERLVYGAIDRPDPRDYYAEHILGVDKTKEIPESFRMDTKEGNQGNVPACTTFAACGAMKIQNEMEHGKEITPDWFKMWELQGAYGTRIEGKGDYVQTALKNVQDNGLVTIDGNVYPSTGYARAKKDELKYWLSNQFPIVTSTDVTKTNYATAKKTGIWGGNDGAVVTGHAIQLTGYEPGYYIASNSWGETWGYYKDGTFKIKESDIDKLGTCYIEYDQKENVGAKIYKDVTTLSSFADDIFEMKRLELMLGYGDGTFRPNQAVTRGELAAVMNRLYKLLTK